MCPVHDCITCLAAWHTQVAAAAAVMVVTALKLHHVDIQWDRVGWNADVSNTCLLGVMENGGNL
jgi:hypothetical protein